MDSMTDHDNATEANVQAKKPDSPMAKVMKFLIPFAVTVGLCYVMFRDIDFHEMIHVIRTQCDFRWIALMAVLGIVPVVLRAVRWGIQLRAVGVVTPLHVLVYAMFGTYAVNLVFPRLGEVWRSGYVSFRSRNPFSTVFGAMVADRLADTVTVLLLAGATLVIAREPIVEFVRTYPDAYRKILSLVTSPWLWGGVAAGIAVIWAVLKYSGFAWAAKIRKFLKGLWTGFAGIAHMDGKLPWLGLTAGIWICYYLQMAMAFNAFPMTQALMSQCGPTLVLVCFVLTSISMGIPSNGGIGPYQTALLFGLGIFFPLASAMPGADAGALHGMTLTQFRTVGAALGNVIIAAQTLIFIVFGIITFVLIAIDKKSSRQAS